MKKRRWLNAGLGFVLAGMLGACAGSVRYRSYDPYYRDYHTWSAAEEPYYNTWIVETHHPHVEYHKLKRGDRDAYWRWRHDHH